MVSDVEKPSRADGDGDVTLLPDADTATLDVTWGDAENTGPSITGYRVECSGYRMCPTPMSHNTLLELGRAPPRTR